MATALDCRSIFVYGASVSVYTVEEIAHCALGPEHMDGQILPVFQDHVALACGFDVALAPDSTGQSPLIAQSCPRRVVASFGQFARHPQPAPERAP